MTIMYSTVPKACSIPSITTLVSGIDPEQNFLIVLLSKVGSDELSVQLALLRDCEMDENCFFTQLSVTLLSSKAC